jgi:hypothetical protein
MKHLRISVYALLTIFLMTGSVLAFDSPADWSGAAYIRIQDNYVGGNLDKVNDIYEHNGGDVISSAGAENNFDIDWMDVYFLDNYLKVNIHTDYVSGMSSTTYGDLFISTDGWNPAGGEPYVNDTMLNGEKWEYAFDVSGGQLYDITNAQGSIVSSDAAMKAAGVTHDQYRHDQEVLINSEGMTSIGLGTAQKVDGYYSMIIDVSGIDPNFSSLMGNGKLGLHWAMTCGNDVIEGRTTPEPATMFLLGSGLVGLVGLRKRFGKKS